MPTQHAVLPGTPSEVWRLFTTEAIGDWLMPHVFANEFTAEFRDGGTWIYGSPDSVNHLRGTYLDYEPFSRLHFRWALAGTFIEDEMDFLFTPTSEGCHVALTYPPSPSPAEDEGRARDLLSALKRALVAREATR